MRRQHHIDPTPTVAELLAEVRAKFAGFQEQLDRIEARLPRQPDNSADVRLAKAIHEASAGLPFTAAALMENAEICFDETPVLRTALDKVLGQVDARRLGRWLSDNEGRTFGGIRFARAGSKREGLQWKCETEKSLSRFAGNSDAASCTSEEPE